MTQLPSIVNVKVIFIHNTIEEHHLSFSTFRKNVHTYFSTCRMLIFVFFLYQQKKNISQTNKNFLTRFTPRSISHGLSLLTLPRYFLLLATRPTNQCPISKIYPHYVCKGECRIAVSDYAKEYSSWV